MKRLTELWFVLACELGQWCSVNPERDIKTVAHRSEHEGESFYTIELPMFAEAFEQSLALMRLEPSLFRGWKLAKKGRRSPAFLQGFLLLVFDPITGDLLPYSRAQAHAVYAIRQLTLLAKKVEPVRYSTRSSESARRRRSARAIKQYADLEVHLKRLEESVDLGTLPTTFAMLYSSVMNAMDRKIQNIELRPKHGPGSTADGVLGNKKFLNRTWPLRLQREFPYQDYAVAGWNSDLQPPVYLAPSEEIPVKVITVPKTQKSPRIIAMEPVHMQYMQQALLADLVPLLESDPIVGPLIGFSSQEENRSLARYASLSGALATLDLSEASDRLLNSIVVKLTAPWPNVADAIQATRSRRARLPDNTLVRLSKFASMGSAMCFVIEAMVFLAIVIDYLTLADNPLGPGRWRSISDYHGQVRVYGDDIIVPVHSATDVEAHLESFGLKVNRSKSFSTGPFRESCGGDYFFGQDVGVVKLRTEPLPHRNDDGLFLSLLETRNLFYERGLVSTAKYIDAVQKKVRRVPVKPKGSQGGIGRYSDSSEPMIRSKALTQSTEVLLLKNVSRPPANAVGSVGALTKCTLGDFSDPLYSEHLTRSGRPASVNLKMRWMQLS